MSTIDYKKIDYYEFLLNYISKKYPYIVLESVNRWEHEKRKGSDKH